GRPVDAHVVLGQVQSARAGDDHGGRLVLAQAVLLPLGGGEGERAVRGVAEVEDAADLVEPGRARGVLEIREPDLRPGVQGVDRHLGGHGRAGDLDAAVPEGGRRLGDRPALVLADRAGRLQEVEAAALRGLAALLGALGEELEAPLVEAAVQLGDEVQRLGGEDVLGLLEAVRDRGVDGGCGAGGARGAPFSGCPAVPGGGTWRGRHGAQAPTSTMAGAAAGSGGASAKLPRTASATAGETAASKTLGMM